MHWWAPWFPWFSMSDMLELTIGGVTIPAMVFPLLWEDHVNNHLFIGLPLQTWIHEHCQVKGTPKKSEGIEPFTMVNTPPCQVKVTPPKSEGIDPFTMVNIPPCQVEVTPHKSEGIDPFTMVNNPPCQVGAVPT